VQLRFAGDRGRKLRLHRRQPQASVLGLFTPVLAKHKFVLYIGGDSSCILALSIGTRGGAFLPNILF
jgi:hypothetical protein